MFSVASVRSIGWSLFAGVVLLTNVGPAWSDAAGAGNEKPAANDEAADLAALEKLIKFQKGPCTANVGTIAEIKVPAGMMFTDAQGAQTWAKITQNPPNPNELGVLMPKSGNPDWFICFTFEEVGFVKDDDKDKLDADAILENMKRGTEASNEYRKSQGWSELHVTGWQQPPAYDPETNNLVWAVKLRSEGTEGVNYNMRILGRRGVMSATLVGDPDALNELIPKTKQIVSGFSYKTGNKYSEFRSGDKVAAYGLAGLIGGGAAAVAAKTGLLAKLASVFAKAGKAIVVGLVAVGAGIVKFFSWILGRNQETESA